MSADVPVRNLWRPRTSWNIYLPMLQAQAAPHSPCWRMSVLSAKRDPYNSSKAPSGKTLLLLPSLFLLSFLPPHAEAGNRFRMQLTLIYVFHLSNYFYYLNVFLMARFWMINESKWELSAQWSCTVSARSINPLAIWNTYMQLIRELQWKQSTMTQLLIKYSLLLLGLSHNMPDGFQT